MSVSRRKKLIRERKLSMYSQELKRAKKFASASTLQEFKDYVPSRSYIRVPAPIPSYEGNVNNENATAKAATKEYSGEYVTGLATLHKSNIVPVGKDDNPVDYATMRRN